MKATQRVCRHFLLSFVSAGQLYKNVQSIFMKKARNSTVYPRFTERSVTAHHTAFHSVAIHLMAHS